MKIIQLEIHNICECRHALLKFPFTLQKSPLYLVHSDEKCEIITLAVQLICGIRYTKFSALNEIRDKISTGKVQMIFSLLKPTLGQSAENASQPQDHSSDSDVPCTSTQAQQRLERRLERRRRSIKQKYIIINAYRDFTLNPDLIVYTVDGGPRMECPAIVFQIRFFSCTDIILPRLKNITHGEYCNGRWLDLLSTEFIDKETNRNKLIKKFSQLYAERKISESHILCELTKSVLTAKHFLDRSRVSHLINIFNDIRWLFEYMTCSEFTVWFLLPTVFGNLQDITKINTENINFDSMRTQIQLKQSNAIPFPWTQAEKHVQELLLVAIQLAFGYHCHQNIIYLHSLNYLKEHQSFQYLNYSLIQSSNNRQLFFEKDYLNRIFNVCAKLEICCVLEYCGGLLSYPSQGFVINCKWLGSCGDCCISVTDDTKSTANKTILKQNFLQQLEDELQ